MKLIATSLMLAGMLLLAGCSGSEELIQQQQQQIADQQKQMEEVQTENTSLRQRIVKLEQDKTNLEARLSEAEAKVMMERDRADKAEADLAEAMKPKVKMKAPAEMPNWSADMPAGYADAWTAYGSRNYDDAIAKFEALLGANVANNWADNCHYWIGECNYGKKQYAEAVKHFDMVVGYAGSEKLADAHFMMAQSYDRMGDKAKAKEHYETVVKDFPTSHRVELAKQRAATR